MIPPVLAPESVIADESPLYARPGMIAVHLFSQRASPACVAWCHAQLSPEERGRAERFVYREHREEYVVAHGVMRHLLARYVGISAPALQLTVQAQGKPMLDPRHARAPSISFNLSHSNGRALLAVSDGRAIGADLEARSGQIDSITIAKHYFFGAEYEAIVNAPAAEQHDVFLRFWVAKEAVLKGEGIGLGFPLDRFQVCFAPDSRHATATVTTLEPHRLADNWIVRMVPCEPGWHAAVTARGDHWALAEHA